MNSKRALAHRVMDPQEKLPKPCLVQMDSFKSEFVGSWDGNLGERAANQTRTGDTSCQQDHGYGRDPVPLRFRTTVPTA
ncbi:MAG: hypothetical protein D6704_10820 [Nitrospirae bacterium]|nr:MAG: hypothetical protein D6704_10820 [Nitrospirota bacterium]